jgi:hypothetical protein
MLLKSRLKVSLDGNQTRYIYRLINQKAFIIVNSFALKFITRVYFTV